MMLTACYVLFALGSQGTTLDQIRSFNNAYDNTLQSYASAKNYIETAEAYKKALDEAKSDPIAKTEAQVKNIEDIATKKLYRIGADKEIFDKLSKARADLNKSQVAIAKMPTDKRADLPEEILSKFDATTGLLDGANEIKNSDLLAARSSFGGTASGTSDVFKAYQEKLDAAATAVSGSKSFGGDYVTSVSKLKAQSEAYKGFHARATDAIAKVPVTGVNALPAPEVVVAKADEALKGVKPNLIKFVDARIEQLKDQNAEQRALIGRAAEREVDEVSIRTLAKKNAKENEAEEKQQGTLKGFLKGEKKLDEYLDLFATKQAITEILGVAIPESLNGWKEREIKLYYFDDVKQLVEMLGADSIKTYGTVNDTDIGSALRNAIADRAKAQGKVTDAKNRLIETNGELEALRQKITDRSRVVAKSETERKKAKSEVDDVVRKLTEEKTRLETEQTINAREITETEAAITKVETELKSKPDDLVLKAKKDKLEADLAKQREERKENDRKLADVKAKLETANGQQSEVATAAEDAQLKALSKSLEGLEKELETAEGDLRTQNEAVRGKAIDAVLQAQIESAAFAKKRDTEPAYVSRPKDLSSSDPLQRVTLYGLPDRRIIIRGRSEDVDRVYRVIFQFDQPQAQAELSLYSFEVNVPFDKGGLKSFTKNLTVIDSLSQQNELAVQAIRDALRDGLVQQRDSVLKKYNPKESSQARQQAQQQWQEPDSNSPINNQGKSEKEVPKSIATRRELAWLSNDAIQSLKLHRLEKLIYDPIVYDLVAPRVTGLTTISEILSALALANDEVRLCSVGFAAEKIHGANRFIDFLPTAPDQNTFVVWANIMNLEDLFGAAVDFDMDVKADSRVKDMKESSNPVEAYRVKSLLGSVEAYEKSLDSHRTDPQWKAMSLTARIQEAIRTDDRKAMGIMQALLQAKSEIHIGILKSGTTIGKVTGLGALIAFREHLCNELYRRGVESILPLLPRWYKQKDLLIEALLYIGAKSELDAILMSQTKDYSSIELKDLVAVAEQKGLEHRQFNSAEIERRHVEISRSNEDFKIIMKRFDDALRQAITEPLLLKTYEKLASNHRFQVGFLHRQTMTARNRLVARMDPEATAETQMGSSQNVIEGLEVLTSFATQAKDQAIPGLLSAFKGVRESNAKEPSAARIFGIDSGSTFAVTPIFDPTGQALRFRLDYVYSNRITEPNGSSDPKQPQISRNSINTEVQMSNMEMKRVAEFTSVAQLGQPTRRQGGLPILRDIKGVDSWPLVGWFVQRSGKSAIAQHHILFSRAVMYPTITDIVNLLMPKGRESYPSLSTPK